MSTAFKVLGKNKNALFSLTVHRGDGMALLAMNWKKGKPPLDFVGFAVEYKEPGGDKFFQLKNRIGFQGADGSINPNMLSSKLSPIQKFRWVHFPRNAEMAGKFTYKVTPVFMNAFDELSYGEHQQVSLELRRETFPNKLNVAYTRGFVSSQAFVDRYESKGGIDLLLPSKAELGLGFAATHPLKDEALKWMGFEARSAVLEVLDKSIADKKSTVCVLAYDLNEPEIVSRLEKLGTRLSVIIDDDAAHGHKNSAESQAATRLRKSAGKGNVKRQHMGKLQHNKVIIVSGPKTNTVVCGSTNFSWRGMYVQSNNALIIHGKKTADYFLRAFDSYWAHGDKKPFKKSDAAVFEKIPVSGIDVSVGFSPYNKDKAMLATIASDISSAKSSLMYSLAFLYQTPGPILDSIAGITKNKAKFVYGISDSNVGGLDLQTPDGNVAPVSPAVIAKNIPEPFKKEPSGGKGIRMHHKFVVIDFDKPTARVYLGSYNFSDAADTKNGENLVLIKDRRVATSYMIEALRMIDHYHFRLLQANSETAVNQLYLKKPPRLPKEEPWWLSHYSVAHKVRDRILFSNGE